MGGGSIFVDTDAVFRVSTQVTQCADEIESLRNYIVPQVYEVIDRGLGVSLSPRGSSSLESSYSSIVRFNHEAQVVVQNLRISAQGLQQIAEESLKIERELHQLPAVFPIAGRSSASSTSSSGLPLWLQDIDTFDTALGILLFATGLGPIHGFLKDKPFFRDLFPLMGTAGWQVGFDTFDVLLDFANGKDHSPRAFLSDILGSGIGVLVGYTPQGRIADTAAFIIGVGGSLLASGQDWLGNTYGGPLGTTLKRPEQGLQWASKDASLGSLFDHIGRYLVDEGGKPGAVLENPALAPIAIINGIASAFGAPLSRPEDVPADTNLMAHDTWHIVRSVPEFAVNVGAASWSDGLALDNTLIHLLPLPSGIKGFSETATENVTGTINDAASFITHLLRIGS